MKNYRKRLISGFTFFGGLYFFLEFVLPKVVTLGDLSFEPGKYHQQISLGVMVVGAMAIGLGVLNILMVHGGRCFMRKKGWVNSMALLVGLVLMILAQSVDFVNSRRSVKLWKPLSDMALYVEKTKELADTQPGAAKKRLTYVAAEIERIKRVTRQLDGELSATPGDKKVEKQREFAQSALSMLAEKCREASSALESKPEQATEALSQLQKALSFSSGPVREHVGEIYSRHIAKQTIDILFDGFFMPLGSAMFSLLAFYIAYAAYRSFRLRSMEASVLMFTAIAIILGQIPQGPMYISEHLPAVRLWLMENVNTPGNRAIYFGSAIAGLAMAVRMWFSLERSPLDAEDAAPGAVKFERSGANDH